MSGSSSSNSYLPSTTDLPSALTDLTLKMKEQAGLVKIYPLLKRATSSSASQGPTPGYIYLQLAEFTFQSRQDLGHQTK